jgi:formate hydrogenlyase transcriptional activator
MTALTDYHWPGNVRELEHFIERAVILSLEPELQLPPAEFTPPTPSASAVVHEAPHAVTLKEAERAHIQRTLEETHWVIGGPTGAADRLGLKRTTLQALVKRLGIDRPRPSQHLGTCQNVGSHSSSLASQGPSWEEV